MDNIKLIIVHCHIFKNAGTTFDWSLNRCFGDKFEDDQDGKPYSADYLQKLLDIKKDIRAISNHHIRLPLPEIAGFDVVPVFIIRHPIERIYSVFKFEKNQIESTPGSINARSKSFKEYVLWRMDPNNGSTIRNYQTRYCSGWKTREDRPVTEKDYNLAIGEIIKTPLLGIVDKYDESMVIFENWLKQYYPDLDLSYVRKNIGNYRKNNIMTMIKNKLSLVGNKLSHTERTNNYMSAKEILKLLGDDISRIVIENNRYDLNLYDKAKNIVINRCDGIGSFENKIMEFKNRCTKLT